LHNFAYNDNYLVVANAAYGKLDTDTPHGSKINATFDITDQAAPSTSARLRQAATYPQVLDWLTRYQLNKPPQAGK
jgi:hypothetical protein